jgi:hypothetical protein
MKSERKPDMKTKYLKPLTEVKLVEAYALLLGVSGAGLGDGGQTIGDTIDPQ